MSANAVKVAPRRFGGSATPCGSCDKPVYHAESVMGPMGRSYHRACLRCTSCGKTLDAVRLLEHDGDPFCKPCHTSNFGIEGYGHGGASTKANYTDRWSPSPRSSPRSSPDKPLSSGMFPSRSSGGSPLKSPVAPFDAAVMAEDEDGDEWEPKPPVTAQPAFVPRGPRAMDLVAASGASPRPVSPALSDGTNVSSGGRSSAPSTSAASVLEGGPDRCPRCQNVVYFAERMQAAGRIFHRRCMRCTSCSKALDSHLVVSGNDPYCRQCHSKIGGLAQAGIMSRPGLC